MKPVIAPIEGERIRLRPLAETDLPLTLAWRNQDHIRRWFFHSDIIQPEQHRAWFDKYRAKDDDFVFIIVVKETDTPIGQVALYRIDRVQQEAEFGRIMIGEASASGKGYAREATQLIVQRFGFEQLGLRRIYLEVFADNAPAIAIYEKCGFRRVGEQGGQILMEIVRSA
ncbi:MAG: GNAT family N-acetyltransferase [Candidatus Flexifilum sp.]